MTKMEDDDHDEVSKLAALWQAGLERVKHFAELNGFLRNFVALGTGALFDQLHKLVNGGAIRIIL